MDFLDNLMIEVPPFLDNILVILALFLAIWIMQRILTWVLVKFTNRAVRLAKDNWEDEITSIIQQPIRYISIALGLFLSLELIEVEANLAEVITSLGRSLFIIALFVAVFKAVDVVINSKRRLSRMTGLAIHHDLIPFMRTALKILIVCISVVVVMQEWGYNATGLVAGLGLGGLAFSLAAQDTVANLFGFTTIVGDRPFNVGEFIEIDGVAGTVEKVGVRSTRIRRLNQSLVIVPNSKLADSILTNWSRLSKRRVDLSVGLTYASQPEDIESITQDFEEMLKSREAVQADSVQVVFAEMEASSLDILIRCYVNITDWFEWMKEREAIQLALMIIVRNHNLSLAFPSRSIYVENVPELVGKFSQDYEPQLN